MPVLRVIGGPCDGQTIHLPADYHGGYAQVNEVGPLELPEGVADYNINSISYVHQHTYKIMPLHDGTKKIMMFLVPPDWTSLQLFERLASGYLTPDLNKTPWLA